jgi:hypothetical protein
MTQRPDILLIDADTPAYIACQSSEIEVEHGDWHMVASNFSQAVSRFQDTIELWQKHFQCETIELFFTGRTNFRKTVDPEYKGNRLKRKPLGLLRRQGPSTDPVPPMEWRRRGHTHPGGVRLLLLPADPHR